MIQNIFPELSYQNNPKYLLKSFTLALSPTPALKHSQTIKHKKL